MIVGIFKEVIRRPVGAVCLGILAFLYFCTIFSQPIAPYRPETQNLQSAYHPPTRILFKNWRPHVQVYENVDPSAARYEPIEGETVPIQFFARGSEYRFLGLIPMERRLFSAVSPHRIYLLGSDGTGQDVFSGVRYGAQVSVIIGFIGIMITMTLGFLVVGIAGYFCGAVDFGAMRMVEFIMAIPSLYLLIALRGALGDYFESGHTYLMIVIILAFLGWAGAGRVHRGKSLSNRPQPFVLAAEVIGRADWTVMF